MKILRNCWVLIAFAAIASSASAQEFKVEAVSVAAPAELAPAVRETLGNAAMRVVGPEGPLCEIWLRKVVPARATPQQALGIAYGQFEEGTLIGAVRFLREARDFRKQLVKPGVFTLRDRKSVV